MSHFMISGFGDEVGTDVDTQIRVFQALGIEYVEVRDADSRNITEYTPREAQALAARFQSGGIGVSAMGSRIGKISIHDAFEPHLEQFRRAVEIAQSLGTSYIRIFSFFMDSPQDYGDSEAEVMRRMEKLVKAAQGSGILPLLENEKHLFGDTADRCLKIAQAFSGGLGITFDPSNYVQCWQEPKEAFKMLRPYIRYLHMKDSTRPPERAPRDTDRVSLSPLHQVVGKGDGEIPWILRELHQDHFEGFLSLEPDLFNCPGYTGDDEERFTLAARTLQELGASVTA